MTKRNTVLIGLAAVGLYALTAYAEAPTGLSGMWHHHKHKRGGGTGRLIPLLLHSTDLTHDQQTQAHQILDANRPAAQQLFTQLHQAQKDLATLLLAPEVQKDAVATQQTRIT